MGPIEARKTNVTTDKLHDAGINSVVVTEVNRNVMKEHSSSSSHNQGKYGSGTSINSLQKNQREVEKSRIETYKRKVLSMLTNENIVVGYTSMTEVFLSKLLENDRYEVKEILNLIYVECFDQPEILQRITEVMSNLDYDKLFPTNTILAMGVINHIDIGVQEAAIAAFEKWDDKRNLPVLKNINYTTDWIEDYAREVIQYLESC